jgi:hypothetical protein
MKIIILALFILLGSRAAAWADDEAMAATMIATEHSVLGGVVKSVSWADQSKGTKSEIVVKDAAGKISHILVTSNTTLWDGDAKAIMPDKILPKCRVNVIYLTTDEGLNVGKSIKILK